MYRIRYLVSYDISNPKRLRKVARSLEGFGVRLQYSVFECPLDGIRLAKLQAELQPILKSLFENSGLGSTGHWPVPSGDPPDGTGRTTLCNADRAF